MSVLNTDTLGYALSFLGEDAASLRNVLLVSLFFFDSAARILYREVVYSPAYSRVLNLGHTETFAQGKVAAACLPRYAQHVLKFEISGHPWCRPHEAGAFAAEVEAAIKRWPNLLTVVLMPQGTDKNLTTRILALLPELCRLSHLTVGGSCTEDAHAPLLLDVRHLETLSIVNPTRAILNVLPQWLEKLSTSIKSFALRDNCGSVTPGVLRSFTPHVHEITSFSFGLSYSLTNDDVFAFLNGLPCLRSLELRYYLQLRTPAILPALPHLQYVTIHHPSIATKPQANNLCTWTRRLVAHSPVISLRLIGEDVNRGTSVAFDGLIGSLAASHCRSLRALRMDSAFVGHEALLRLIASCPLLEELGISTTVQGINALERSMQSLDRLHILIVETRNIKPSHVVIDDARALNFFVGGKIALRYLRINQSAWRGLWTSTPEHIVQFNITRII